MKIGVGVSLAALAVLGGDAGSPLGVDFNPSQMFLASEVGAVYDPSDLTSLYSSRTGGDCFQTEARRNLLLQTENVASSSWVKVGVSAAITSVVSPPIGARSVDKVVGASGASTTRQYYQSITVVSGPTYVSTAYYRAAEYDKAVINEVSTGRFGARFDFTAKTAVSMGGAGFVSCALTELPDGWFRCEVVWTSNGTSYAISYGGYPTGATLTAAGVSYAGDGTSGIYVTGVQTELAAAPTAYQRVGASFDYIGSTVGIMLDKSKMGGMSAAAYIAGQPDLVVNGGFDADTTWTKGTGWTISGGQAVGTSVATGQALRQTIVAPAGDLYAVTLDVVATAGLFNIWFNTSGIFVSVSTTGRHTFLLRASGANDITISAGAVAFTGTIDNISIKRIPGFHAIAPSDAARPILRLDADATIMAAQPELVTNGTFDTDLTGWVDASSGLANSSVTGGRANVNNAAADGIAGIARSFTTAVGKAYRFSVDVVSTTNGYRVGVGTSANDTSLSNSGEVEVAATQTQIFVATGTTAFVNLYTFPNAVTTANQTTVFDNVSVKEIPLSAYRYYLETDGVDDWMQVLPACDLGAVWSHVGGWRTLAADDWLFSTSSDTGNSGPFLQAGRLMWRNSAVVNSRIGLDVDTTNLNRVICIEQLSTVSLRGRENGVDGVTLVPKDDTAAGTQALGLFSANPTSASLTHSGRFYGGVWINRAITAGERSYLEPHYRDLAGIAA